MSKGRFYVLLNGRFKQSRWYYVERRVIIPESRKDKHGQSYTSTLTNLYTLHPWNQLQETIIEYGGYLYYFRAGHGFSSKFEQSRSKRTANRRSQHQLHCRSPERHIIESCMIDHGLKKQERL